MGDSLYLGIEIRFAQFTGGGPVDGGDSDNVHCKPSVRRADRALPRLFILKNCFTFDILKPSFKNISTDSASSSLLRRSFSFCPWRAVESVNGSGSLRCEQKPSYERAPCCLLGVLGSLPLIISIAALSYRAALECCHQSCPAALRPWIEKPLYDGCSLMAATYGMGLFKVNCGTR